MRWILCLLMVCVTAECEAQESWQEAFSRMPLAKTNVTRLDEKNCVKVMLNAFQSNGVVKALIFMPGSTDEFYMFHRAGAVLTNSSPTLLDAVLALTNQSFIRVTFRPPFLLLHSDEDPLDPLYVINDQATADKIRRKHFVKHVVFFDRDWNYVEPVLRWHLGVTFRPERHTTDSWHFYRHSVSEFGLDGWETLEAIALAGKTKFTVDRRRVTFEGDARIRQKARLDNLMKQ